MPLDLEGVGTLNEPLIELTEPKKTFRFRNVAQKPVLSLNRGFSAPIRIKSRRRAGRPAFPDEARQRHFQSLGSGADGGRHARARRDSTASAAQQMPKHRLIATRSRRCSTITQLDHGLQGRDADAAERAGDRHAHRPRCRSGAIHRGARCACAPRSARRLMPDLLTICGRQPKHGPLSTRYRQAPGRRSLRYAVLQAIAGGDPTKGAKLAMAQLAKPPSMTDEIGALSAARHCSTCRNAMKRSMQFYARHSSDHLLVDKWFALQASVPLHATPERVRELMRHPIFKLDHAQPGARASSAPSPWAIRSASMRRTAKASKVLADTIIALDPLNPQVAARIATAFRSWADARGESAAASPRPSSSASSPRPACRATASKSFRNRLQGPRTADRARAEPAGQIIPHKNQ